MRPFPTKWNPTTAVVVGVFHCALLIAFSSMPLLAQDGESTPSRSGEIQADRIEKAQHLSPETPTNAERHFSVKRLAEQVLWKGNPHLQVGGLPPGAGFGVGPAIEWNNSTDAIRMNLSAVGAISGSYKVQSGLVMPQLGSRTLSFSLLTAHSDSTRLNYYGPGNDSRKGDRTNYTEEDTTGDAVLRWSPAHERLVMEWRAGELLVNVGRGHHRGIASIETLFNPAETPGIDVQTNFFVAAYSVKLDMTDSKGDPHKGGRLALGYTHYSDLKKDTYSFGLVTADAQLYLPYFNRKRVLALRARTELTHAEPNNLVPFYLQPTLGESADFRGFRPYRFRDNNLLLLNVEHRWEISSGFDMAVFADSGRVFGHAREIKLSHLKNSVGFGFRFKSRNSVVMRIDTGFSREGFQTWVKFGNVF